jgi:hypothetical protein
VPTVAEMRLYLSGLLCSIFCFHTYILLPVSTSFSVHTVRYPADVSRKAKIHSVLDWHHSNLRQGAGASYSTRKDVHSS